MAKFKVGSRVVVARDSSRWNGHSGAIVEFEGEQDYVVEIDGYFGRYVFSYNDLVAEPATPTEHPALTLAKAEVAQLTAVKDRNDLSEYGQHSLRIHLEYLRAFGLRYAPKPGEYEFVSIDPEQGA